MISVRRSVPRTVREVFKAVASEEEKEVVVVAIEGTFVGWLLLR